MTYNTILNQENAEFSKVPDPDLDSLNTSSQEIPLCRQASKAGIYGLVAATAVKVEHPECGPDD